MNNLFEDIKGKKAWIFFGGAALIVAGFLILTYLDKNASKTVPLEVTTTELGKATVPKGLPHDLPVEAGSKILQNYEARSNDGRLQSTRQISVSQAAPEALQIYLKFLETKGWQGGVDAAASIEGGQQAAIMKNPSGMLMIVATPAGDNKSIVELTLTQAND
jgi:hypothetical protein